MMRTLLCFALLLTTATASAQFEPPEAKSIAPEVRKSLEQRLTLLGQKLEQLRQQGVGDPTLVNVEVYHKAGVWLLRHNEFFKNDYAARAVEVLERGLLRASQAARGESPWLYQRGHSVARAYRSNVDGSVQPYAVTFPKNYGVNKLRRWRIDVVLHGRNKTLSEVSFLHQHDGRQQAPDDQGFVKLEVYGRGNNAYRWAGESDVHEALGAFLEVERLLGRSALLDTRKTVLRGFSMGGAGTWHLGLHHPGRWAVLGPGAGFTTTHGYVKNLPDKLPAHQEACLHIYDAVDYAENALDLPIVAYGGEKDAQLQAAQNIQTRLDKLKIPMTLLIGPGLAHKFPAEWQAKAEAEYQKAIPDLPGEYADRVHFVTYTMKYNRRKSVRILGLEQHYQESKADVRKRENGFEIKTKNVRLLEVGLWPGAIREPLVIDIDGQRLETLPAQKSNGDLALYLQKRDGHWQSAMPQRIFTEQLRRPQKTHALQGPIDDAFTGKFLCVQGTGACWHAETQAYSDANLARFRAEWSKYLRGDLPIKKDVDVTPQDIANCHLILFGDPASNSLIEQVVPGLPLSWTKDKIALRGKEFEASNHVPVMIYPSPLHPNRYVVLNSGHTFHEADFRGTNALLFPRLGDYAVLKRTPTKDDPLKTEVEVAGLFDDYWKLTSK